MRCLVLFVAVVATVAAQPITKRSMGFTNDKGSVGQTGIIRADGTMELFTPEFAHSIILITPAGIVTEDGNNIQLDDNLHRAKRHIVGDGSMLTSWGQPIMFLKPFTKILLDGASGLVLTDGQVFQKPVEY